MGRIDRRLDRLEGTYGSSGDEWPPDLLAAAFERLSARDLEVIEGYVYPDGVASAPSLAATGWEHEPTEEQAAAIARLEEHVGDIRDERGVY